MIIVNYRAGLGKNLKSRFPSVKFIHLSYDPGPSAQHNIGEAASKEFSKYLIMMDNGVFFHKSSLRTLIHNHPKA